MQFGELVSKTKSKKMAQGVNWWWRTDLCTSPRVQFLLQRKKEDKNKAGRQA